MNTVIGEEPIVPHGALEIETTEAYAPLRYSFVSFEGYLCAKLVTEVLRRSGSPWDRQHIVRATESIRHFDLGLESSVTFSAQQHQGLHTVYFTRVLGDRFVPLTNWKEVVSSLKEAQP